MNKFFSYSFFTSLILISLIACKKNNLVIDKEITPPSFARFSTISASDTIKTYTVTSANDPFKLPIGITTVSNTDRTIQLAYTSNTAVKGTQYSSPETFVIPAGKAVDTLIFRGIYSGFSSTTSRDTVKISILGGDVPASAYKSKYYVIMKKG